MIDQTGIQLRNPTRSELAALMAAYEAEHGAVQTLPILCGTDKRIPFIITNPEKPKRAAKAKQSQAIRQHDDQMIAANANKKAKAQARLDLIKTMATTGAKIRDMADATTLNPKSVMRLLKQHGIKRGPQMNLEAV